MSSTTSDSSARTRWLILIAFGVGIIAGFGSIAFRCMIGFIHNLSFNGVFSFFYDTNTHTSRSIWGIGIIFVPVIGAAIVSWITQKFSPEARGHGVPEVMNAIYYQEGKIRPIVALVKAIASSISIGTGGSVGREGPIIQIGSAFGSLLGQVIKMTTHQRNVLIAAGAAAGIAATFNTPIGGVAFAMELMLVSISALNVALVSIATVTATMISHMFLGTNPSFFVPDLAHALGHMFNPHLILLFIPFGIIMGGAAALFTHSIYWSEDAFNKYIKNPYARHMIGMFALGITLYLMMTFTGHYYVEGVGYATILDILRETLTNPWFLLLICIIKLLATNLTLGSGASGGVFSPALFMGAALGAAYAGLFNHLFPSLQIPPAVFAIAGMAAMVGGTTGAVLTAITMTFEQTRDYSDILPIIITVAVAYATRVRITTESIYTLKLYRRGLSLPKGLQAAVSVDKRARQIMTTHYDIIDINHINQWVQKQGGAKRPTLAIVTENEEILGVIRRELHYLMSDIDAKKLIDPKYITLSANTLWPALVRAFEDNETNVALISQHPKSKKTEHILGIVTRHELVRSSHQLAKLME